MLSHEFFVVANYVSVAIMTISFIIIAAQPESRMQKYALLVSLSLTMCCLGFLFKVEGKDADSLVIGQKIVYAFVTHGMFMMLLFILDYCKFKIPFIVRIIFHTINMLVSFIVLTNDYHHLFYKSYWAVDMGGYFVLEKEYGFMHTVTVGLFALYMLSAILITIIFSIKNIRKRSKYAWRILIAVMIPFFSYIAPKLTNSNNDFQPMAFALFILVVLYMIYQNNLYDVDSIALSFSIKSMDEALIILDDKNSYKGSNSKAESMFPVLKELTLDSNIIENAKELEDFINGDLKEYRTATDIYSVVICPVFEGTIAQGKVIKFENVTLERKYNEMLESKVATLSNYSYTDELTNLGNRRSFEDTLSRIRELNDTSNIIVGSADLNGLKKINDTVGHQAGDELIIGASKILNDVFSKYGEVFRTGGDEFMIIIEEDIDNLNDVIDELEREEKNWKGLFSKNMSISIGFAFGKEEKYNIDQLVVKADRIMYENKNEYHNKTNE